MHDMKKLAQLIGELEDQLVVCMRCGMCQAVCPLFAETGRESDVARGKLALLDGLAREMFKNPKGVNERLRRCLLCGSCAANCPSGVKVFDIFIKARAILGGYMGLSPIKRAVFRGMLARPEFFNRLLALGAGFQGAFIRPANELLGTSCALFPTELANRHFKPLAPVPFHRMAQAVSSKAGKSGLRIGFFIGCLVDKVFPQVGEALLRSMEHHGVGVFIPQGQGCCGIPALSSGDRKTYDKLVRHNLERFGSEPFDCLVTACATCTSTIKKIWPMIPGDLDSREQENLRALGEKTLDVAQFLVDKIPGIEGGFEGHEGARLLTYHDPCHLKKSLGISAQPRTLIKANPRYSFKEMAEPDRCCGCGGSFNLEHYELSFSIGKRKRDDIVRSGCSVVATSCPACMLQISDLLSQCGDPIEVRHAIEIYAESLSPDN